MCPEVGATELVVIAMVALIVVGPKDLPMLLRKLGQFMAKMRNMAGEFRASFDEMARQSELDELRREVDALRSGKFLDPSVAAASAHTAEVSDIFNEIEHDIAAMPAGDGMAPEPEPTTDAWGYPLIQPPEPVVEPPAAKPARKPRAAKAPDPSADPLAAAPPPKPRAKRAAKAPVSPEAGT